MADVNGIEVKSLQEFKEKVKRDLTKANRDPKLIARWVDGEKAEVEYEKIKVSTGGKNELNAIQMLLASFADCDVDRSINPLKI